MERSDHQALVSLITAIVACVTATALNPNAAWAHLSIIRQGLESAGTAEATDDFGAAVAFGDFNGDGEDDLATGAPGEDGPEGISTGSVTISYGSKHGLTHLGSQELVPGDNGPEHAGQLFGRALAAGDLNGDGFIDLIVGAPGQDVGIVDKAGAIHFYAGGPGGLTPWLSLTQDDLGWTSRSNAFFGASIVADNFLDDGELDLAVGAPGRGFRPGTVTMIYGWNGGPFGPAWEIDAEDLGEVLQSSDQFGFALASGDVMGDGRTDLVIGSPYRNVTVAEAGTCYVLPGTQFGIDQSQAVTLAADLVGNVEENTHFGSAVAVVEQSGYDRLVIGEPDREVNAVPRAGRVLTVRGGDAGPDPGTAASWTQEDFGGGSESNDRFGAALASGHYESDIYEDVAVGTPGEDLDGASAAGYVHVLLGGVSGIGSSGWYGYHQGIIGDVNEGNDDFGTSLCLGGQFDETNDGTLIVGAPGEDGAAGSVHVVAPWRQFAFQSHDEAIVTNCEGEVVFSQKPFDQVFIASTTKIMTVLLACERTQLPTEHPDYVDGFTLYTVPAWVANIPGSSAGLVTGEQVSLFDLMYMALLISGNDAAHAIADVLHGSLGGWESVPLFVNEMNLKALDLEMYGTHFNNPNGFEQEAVGPDLGDHFSTAYDMAILSRAALENSIFRSISGDNEHTAFRYQSDGTVVEDNFQSFQMWNLQSAAYEGLGVKGGFTPAAEATYCAAARGVFGDVVATTFGSPNDLAVFGPDLNRLLGVGLESCDILEPYEPWDYDYVYVKDNILAENGITDRFGSRPYGTGNLSMNLYHGSNDVETTDARVLAFRDSEYMVAQNGSIFLGVSPFESHEDLVVRNRSERVTKIRIVTPFFESFFDLPEGAAAVVPAANGASSDFTWQIESHDGSGEPLHLEIDEAYAFDVVEPPVPGADPVFSVTLEREEGSLQEYCGLDVEWRIDGSTYVFTSHDAGVTVDVPVLGPEIGSDTIQLLSASPNPFTDETKIRFDLTEAAEVEVSIYDASGRQVRRYGSVSRRPGRSSLTWDGRTSEGGPTPPGVYFYQVRAGGKETGRGKMTRVR